MLRDRVLNQFFTPHAAAVLRQVPLRYGDIHGFGGVAIGDDAGSRAAAVLLGFGNGRQVVIDLTADSSTVFHEYVHQAQYEGLINTSLFLERYAELCTDPHYAQIPARWESYVKWQYGQTPALMALLYGRGVTRELIPYLIQGYLEGWYELPEYFLEVYRPAVRLEAREQVRRRW